MPDSEKLTAYELVIGLVSPTGVNLQRVCELINEKLKAFGYSTSIIKVSEKIIPRFVTSGDSTGEAHVDRTNRLMTEGDIARQRSERDDILAIGAARAIYDSRTKTTKPEKEEAQPHFAHATIIRQLKHPTEVKFLCDTYGNGFFLFGVTAPEDIRRRYLQDEKHVPQAEVDKLFERDLDEGLDHGQKVSETFHLSDFFIVWDEDDGHLRAQVNRSIEVVFGNPFETPTFDEFAMYMAFTSSARSADLSRQVGAVVTRDDEILSVGLNDSPKFGGGLYIRQYDNTSKKYVEQHPKGRDYQLGYDANKMELRKLTEKVLSRASEKVREVINGFKIPELVTAGLWERIQEELSLTLQKGPLSHLTEFGRSVHAEMEAILSCARRGVAVKGATLYSTTFPCHNCAKHIVAAGIKRVVYVEPYMKSKAAELHADSVEHCPPGGQLSDDSEKVQLEPFVGVGPRRFIDFFSLRLGGGGKLKRKGDNDSALL
ncbi:cytidine deaminase [Nitrospirales bacterium NOB]|nr:cytidine deaminase [Nitrospirales bacterium NOB]RIK60126.1 MAG: cytidine deaminase [Planctomycetota bacterium]